MVFWSSLPLARFRTDVQSEDSMIRVRVLAGLGKCRIKARFEFLGERL